MLGKRRGVVLSAEHNEIHLQSPGAPVDELRPDGVQVVIDGGFKERCNDPLNPPYL